MHKINGDSGALKNSTLEYMEGFIGAVWSPGSFLPAEVLTMMEDVTLETGREVAVALDRRNRVLGISVGDDKSVALDTEDLRRGEKRLSGVRLLHTHPNGSLLPSDIDRNTLRKMRYDAMVVIGVTKRESFTGINGASACLLSRNGKGEVSGETLFGPCPPREFPAFDKLFDLLRELDRQTEAGESNEEKAERVLVVGVLNTKDDYGPDPLAELKELAQSAGGIVVGEAVQRRTAPDSKYYIGAGLAEELSLRRQALDADTVIFDDELSPSQIRNLENKIGARVIDRTALILDIFAARAKSVEGRLQVELAQQKYRLPRLTGQGIALSRLGGGIGTRGPGESKLTTDRRHILRRIHYLENQLKTVTDRRELLRKERARKDVPTVALVGYTNVGKSTLLNVLCESEVYAEDKLFATLDPSVRKLVTEEKRDYLMIDTVGFINKLPHDIVEAFQSTLEEAACADLLLIVISADNPAPEGQLEIVEDILRQIGAGDKPRYLVVNKMDAAPADYDFYPSSAYGKIFYTSARTGRGISELKAGITGFFTRTEKSFEILIPYQDGKMQAFVHRNAAVKSEVFEENGIRFTGRIPDALFHKIRDFSVKGREHR